MQDVINKVENQTAPSDIEPVLKEVKKLSKLEKFDNAINRCKMAIKDVPDNADLHIELGDLFFEKHRNIYHPSDSIDDAINEYQIALEMKPSDAQLHYKLGRALYLKGYFDKALSYFKTAIKYEKSFAQAYHMLGVIESKRDNLSEAETYFNKAIKVNPLKAAKTHLCLYMLKFNRRFHKKSNSIASKTKALGHLLSASILFPFDGDGVNNIVKSVKTAFTFFPILAKGYYYEKTGLYTSCISLYSTALEKAIGFSPLYIALGDVYKKLNRLEDAINEYRMAVWINPLNLTAYKNLCMTFEELGDYDSAISYYRKLIAFKPNDAVLYSNMANILYLAGDVSAAINAYQTAIILNPNKTWTSVVAQTLGYVYQESQKDYDAAISAYQTASILNPKDIDIYISMGSAFFEKGDLNNALAAYRAALEIEPDNAKVHCNMGYLLWGKNAIPESIGYYKKAVDLDPYYDIAYNNLGVIYLDELGNIEKAIELFEKASEINPNYALAYYNIARALTVKGDKIEAARLFQEAIERNNVSNELDTNEIKERIARLFESE